MTPLKDVVQELLIFKGLSGLLNRGTGKNSACIYGAAQNANAKRNRSFLNNSNRTPGARPVKGKEYFLRKGSHSVFPLQLDTAYSETVCVGNESVGGIGWHVRDGCS